MPGFLAFRFFQCSDSLERKRNVAKKKPVQDTNVMNKGTAVVGFVLAFVTGAGFMYAVDRGNNKDSAVATGEKLTAMASADEGRRRRRSERASRRTARTLAWTGREGEGRGARATRGLPAR